MYEFFLASLPAISLGKISPLTLEAFDNRVHEELPQLALKVTDFKSDVPVYTAMRRFETYLNWRIGRIRKERLGKTVDFAEPEEFFGEVDFCLQAVANAEPLERELKVDEILWRHLDDLSVGDIFNFDQLCIYRWRLALNQKYACRHAEAGKKSFYNLLEIYKSTMEQQI